ncbi:MAG: CRISPR-associated endonuclease Cas2 [Capsulimonadaceae bacterium]|nr:CRISPR-associated endonuclease Cas2 [Capsulimonadaceae bacterium]
MYVIVVYDVNEKRVGKVCKFLRRYLPHVQNSVFEGELTESKLEAVRAGLRKIMVEEQDSALLWAFRDARWTDREIIGTEKKPVSNFL